MNDIELSYKEGEIAILNAKNMMLQNRIDNAVEYCKLVYDFVYEDNVTENYRFIIREIVKNLTEGDCKIVETKSQTKEKRSSK
jgi:hypothetical protein